MREKKTRFEIIEDIRKKYSDINNLKTLKGFHFATSTQPPTTPQYENMKQDYSCNNCKRKFKGKSVFKFFVNTWNWRCKCGKLLIMNYEPTENLSKI